MNDVDERILSAMYGGAHGPWGPLMVALTVLGSGWAAIALLPLLGWPRTRPFAAMLSLAIAAQALAVWALKLAVGRVRPWIALGLPAPLGSPHDGSFPSGHAAGSFCVAVFLGVALPLASRARMGLVAGAALIAVSRVYLGAHFPSDVVGGAALGAGFGAAVGARYARGQPPHRREAGRE